MDMVFHVAVSCNERYVPGALVALAGVAVNAKPETSLKFHVFTEDVKHASIEFMRTTLKRLHPNSEFQQHVCDEKLLAGLPSWAGSRMALVRCFYPRLLPDVDWCLYLDCDVLYLASVEEHFSYRDEGVYACVVQEESNATRCQDSAWIRKSCGVNCEENTYFNSGVLLLNFRRMRADSVPQQLAELLAKHPDVPYADQTALNAVFAGKTLMIPPKFNRLQIFLADVKMEEHPVVHYVCGNPWLPKLSTVANNRFKLWHRFADKYIWQKDGESLRRHFNGRILCLKRISYCLLVSPMGGLFARFMQSVGKTKDGFSWRNLQVQQDISDMMVGEVLK